MGWTWAGRAGAAAILCGSPVLALTRALLAERVESQIIGRPAAAFWPVLQGDAPLVGAIVLLGLIGFASRAGSPSARVLRLGARLLALVAFILQLVDFVLLVTIQMRLELSDLLRFRRDLHAGLTLADGLRWPLANILPGRALLVILLATLSLWAVATLAVPALARARARWPRFGAVAGGILLAATFLPPDRTRLHGWVYPNVVIHNLPQSNARRYSLAFLAKATQRRIPTLVTTGANRRLDVVVLIVESLSSSQSALFSGIDGFTPQLDRLARSGTAYSELLANGYATHLGLVALLQGRVPLTGPGGDQGSSFEGFLSGPSLPRVLASHGYHTEFLTNADIDFVRLGDWLAAIGFTEVVGNRHPAFAAWPRLVLDAVPDHALVDLAIARVEELRRKHSGPFLLVLQTSSSHLPFVDPNRRDNSERAVLGYVDAQIGRLADALEHSGFLADGLLVVTSDHRKMAPLSVQEHERYGLSAFGRIPFLVLGRPAPRVTTDAAFQQADLPGSLVCLLTPECPTTPWRGNLFADPPRPPRCVLLPLPNDRDLVYARCSGNEALIKLDGDGTRLVDGRLSPADERDLLAEIACVRHENTPLPWPRTAAARSGN